jgi:multiple sugar transport system permease protein
MKASSTDRLLLGAGAVAVLGYAAFILLPFGWIVVTAFKRQIDILMAQVRFAPTLSNFERLLLEPNASFTHVIVNSVVASLSTTAAVLAIALLAAFALVHLRVPRWLPPLLLAVTMVFHMVPAVTFVSSWYMVFRQIGVFDTLPGLVLAYIATNLPLGLWLSATYAREVPRELLEAAALDCTGPAQCFGRVFVPLMRNGLIATGLLVFIFTWSDFIIALNLTSLKALTVPVAISTFAQNEQIRYAEMAAGSVLAIIPALLLLLLGQRYIVQGLLSGSAK